MIKFITIHFHAQRKESNGTLNGHCRSTHDVNKMHKIDGNKNISKEVVHVYFKS